VLQFPTGNCSKLSIFPRGVLIFDKCLRRTSAAAQCTKPHHHAISRHDVPRFPPAGRRHYPDPQWQLRAGCLAFRREMSVLVVSMESEFLSERNRHFRSFFRRLGKFSGTQKGMRSEGCSHDYPLYIATQNTNIPAIYPLAQHSHCSTGWVKST